LHEEESEWDEELMNVLTNGCTVGRILCMYGWMKRRWNGEENGSMIGFIRDWEAIGVYWLNGRINGRTVDWMDGGMNAFHKAVP